MTRALFEVGERVKLVSKSSPQYNGEYVVEAIVQANEPYKCRVTNRLLAGKGWKGFGYQLNGAIFRGPVSASNPTLVEIPWDESALRKIYPPSKYSFEQLLSELKQGKMSTIEA